MCYSALANKIGRNTLMHPMYVAEQAPGALAKQTGMGERRGVQHDQHDGPQMWHPEPQPHAWLDPCRPGHSWAHFFPAGTKVKALRSISRSSAPIEVPRERAASMHGHDSACREIARTSSQVAGFTGGQSSIQEIARLLRGLGDARPCILDACVVQERSAACRMPACGDAGMHGG